jgi:nucleoside-diphosphate-sugar epimerase
MSRRHRSEREIMRVFLAGAAGAIGRPLTRLLVAAGHTVTGTTRSTEKAGGIEAAGATAVILDAYDGDAVRAAVTGARPEVVIHQLTDLPQVRDPATYPAALAANERLRIVATPNLIVAARAAGARRFIAQSVAFAYAPGSTPSRESDPLDFAGEGTRANLVRGVVALEALTLCTPGVEGIVLRYGMLYGPGTWYAVPAARGSVHVDAAANAALLAVTRGEPGTYNIAEDDGAVAMERARAQLGFDPNFRIRLAA